MSAFVRDKLSTSTRGTKKRKMVVKTLKSHLMEGRQKETAKHSDHGTKGFDWLKTSLTEQMKARAKSYGDDSSFCFLT